MKITSGLSAFLHVVIILIAWLGVPSARPMLAPVASIEVEIVSDVIAKKLPPKPAPPKPAKRLPPPPLSSEVVKALEPVIESMKEDKAVAIPDVKALEPKPKPKQVVKKKKLEPPRKPRPRPKVKPKPKPKKIVRKPPKKPKKNKPKPLPKDEFASVLKTVEKLNPRPVPPKLEKKVEEDQPFQKIARVLNRKPMARLRTVGEVSFSELDLARRQIEQCWSLPAGARDAENIIVVIRAVVNPDGRVRTAKIVDSGRLAQDPFYRSMAESARRAVLNPRCQPLRLPLEKYSEWRVTVFRFNPKEMF